MSLRQVRESMKLSKYSSPSGLSVICGGGSFGGGVFVWHHYGRPNEDWDILARDPPSRSYPSGQH